MGYYMDQRGGEFFLAAEHVDAALVAVKATAQQPERMGGGNSTQRWFSWVDTEKLQEASTLVQALAVWRWGAYQNNNGNIDCIQFTGEKLGDDLVLFEALAQFVRKGSYIEMWGDDGAVWRWYFDGTKCHELEGRVVFDSPPVE